jgi:cytochrome P450
MIEGIPSPAINPLDPAFARDPYPLFARLREHDPIHRDEVMNAWLVTSFDAFVAIMQDPRFTLDIREWEAYEAPTHPDLVRFRGIEEASLFALPQVDHLRVRRLVSKAFTPRAVRGLEPVIHSIVDECLARVRPAGRLDLVSDLAVFFPTYVISRLIGIPANSRRELRFEQLADVLIAQGSPLLSMAEKVAAAPQLEELYGLIEECIAERRRSPQDDILSALIHAEDEGKRLSREELLSLVGGLISAGSETTASSLVLGLRELLHRPDQLALFRARPELRPNAAEELLRHQVPGYFTMRVAREDVAIEGRAIRRGQLVLPSIAAAHRDPARFPDPDRVDVTRDLSEAALFGRGPHSCLGAQLARLELRVAYGKLVDELPGLRLACAYDEAPFARHPVIRSIASLPLEFDAEAAGRRD